MSLSALEALRESNAHLICALESNDAAAIEAATAQVGVAVDQVRVIENWHDDVDLRDCLFGIAALLLDAQTRVNFLTDSIRLRADSLASARGQLNVQTYRPAGR